MKTRFDMAYDNGFFPYIPQGSLMAKLFYNDYLKEKFIKKMEHFNIPLSVNSLINYLKEQKISQENCRIDLQMLDFTFGGHYCYNYKSIENISNGSDNTLYLFNDYIFIGKRDIFLILKDFSDDFYVKSTNLDVLHYYTAETQLCIFCDNHNIDYLMYHPIEETGNYKYNPFR
jgi:hypothetical protein